MFFRGKIRVTNEWTPDKKVMPVALVEGDLVTIRNIRAATHFRNENDSRVGYYDRTIKLSDITSLSFVVEPISDFEVAAHTFVSFGFADGTYLAVSVEARWRKGQRFSLLAGLFGKYDLIYIVADETDIFSLRAGVRRHHVFIYPILADASKIREMFSDMMKRANSLRVAPEKFNTLFNNCTTNILVHAEHAGIVDLPFYFYLLLPGYADRAAHRRGLIDTDLPFEEAQREFHSSPRIRKYLDHPEFSRLIRETPAANGRIVLGPVSVNGGLETENEQNLVRGA